jgi:glycogen operon protein
MTGDDWNNGNNHALGMLIYGEATDETDDRGKPVKGETMLLLMNASDSPVTFVTPTIDGEGIWAEIIDTAHRELRVIKTGHVDVDAFGLVLLRFGENRRIADVAQ